jgi:Spore Coat Protein U domain
MRIQTTFHLFSKGFVMKKIALIAAMGLIGMGSAMAQSVAVDNNFNVNITLTANCIFQTAPSDINLAYTSFQAGTSGGNTSFGVRCTNNLPYTLSLDRAAGDTGTGTTYAYTDVTTNLNYTLALTAAGGTGNALQQTYTVNALIGALQSGNCANLGGSCTNSAGTDKQRTVTITY